MGPRHDKEIGGPAEFENTHMGQCPVKPDLALQPQLPHLGRHALCQAAIANDQDLRDETLVAQAGQSLKKRVVPFS